ncbi:MAG TPA: DUF494 family protein [Nitrospirota bacterium]|nr:DUF494 family protein [Nitrospirota bacterium]
MYETMITLFSLIAEQIHDKQDLFDEEGKIMQMLLNNGYHIHEADAALMLMQTYVQRQQEHYFTSNLTGTSFPVRVMNCEERERFTIEAFSFVSKLTRLGIISDTQREEVLERALTVYHDRIDIDHIKSIMALILFVQPLEWDPSKQPDIRRIKRTAWN